MWQHVDTQQKEVSQIVDSSNMILLWISKNYYVYQETKIELLESPLGNGETISQVVNDISGGFYPNVIALWYSVDDKKITLAFANRKEGGLNQ